MAEDSVEAAAVPLAVVEADQCAVAAWAEAVVDHSPTENSCSSVVSRMALSPLIYVNPPRKPTKFSQLHYNAYK